jgi:hypothetical protein
MAVMIPTVRGRRKMGPRRRRYGSRGVRAHQRGWHGETSQSYREECVKTGDDLVHLRTCQHCGTTLCCDSSPNRHATKHARGVGHPVVASAQPHERWLYCYVDDALTEY